MRHLPPVTTGNRKAYLRRHAPTRVPYRRYIACLRWEFGFTCAFCLLHERDFFAHGLRGLGLFTVEHRHRQATDPGAADNYLNCHYACRWCNRARGTQDPHPGTPWAYSSDVAWGAAFRAMGDHLVPSDRRYDATLHAYDLNDPRKVELRADRRMAIETAMRALAENPSLIERLLDQVNRSSAVDAAASLDAARKLRVQVLEAAKTLKRYTAVPADCPGACSCGMSAARNLPGWLADQCPAWTPLT